MVSTEEGAKGGIGRPEHRQVEVEVLADEGVSVGQPEMEKVEVLGVPRLEDEGPVWDE